MRLKISIKNIRHRLHLKHFLKLLPIATTLVLLACTVTLFMFLYSNFFETLAQARVVIVLRNQLAISQIDVPLYQQVIAKIKSKKEFDSAVLATLKDPFQPVAQVPSGPGLEQANTPKP